jgi:4-hydroxybenzoate polyprenyltransferase
MTFLWRKRADVARLIRFDKPYGTLLLMFPTLWSLFLASGGRPTAGHLAVFVVGAFLMRSAGCVANDLADRKFDARVARTRNRPLVVGTLSPFEALIVLGLLLSLSFALVLTLNTVTILLSFAALGVALLYPFAKRFTPLPQIVLGVAFSFGILMAWTASRGTLALTPILLFFANLCWATGYDTVYAMMDREDDLKIGVQSTAILFGSRCPEAVGGFYALVIFFLFWAGRETQMRTGYHVALALVACGFAWQVGRLKGAPSKALLFTLFRSQVWVGLTILIGIIAHNAL